MIEHPITPSSDLIQQWREDLPTGIFDGHCWPHRELDLSVKAAKWGADQELAACCMWLHEIGWHDAGDQLLAMRRPELNLKKQAIDALENAIKPKVPNLVTMLTPHEHDIIRRALEQLDD